MQHGICSLGVCQLDIGLRTSFVRYNMSYSDERLPDDTVSYPSLLAWLKSSSQSLDLVSGSLIAESFGTSASNCLVDLAKAELPSGMGDRFTEIVVTGLECLNPGNENFGNVWDLEQADNDGVLLGGMIH
jgi:hypothetical protein